MGKGVILNDSAAFIYFLRGAELNDGDCQAKTAYAYFFGVGTPKDLKEGLSWVQKSVAQKNRVGYHLMSIVFKQGLSVAIDLPQAQTFLEKSAQEGYAEAQFELGMAIMQQNVKGDPDDGLAWLEKAAEEGHPKAIKAVKSIKASKVWQYYSSLPDTKPELTPSSSPSLVSSFSQTIYQPNKKSQTEKKQVENNSSPTYPGLRRGFLNTRK